MSEDKKNDMMSNPDTMAIVGLKKKKGHPTKLQKQVITEARTRTLRTELEFVRMEAVNALAAAEFTEGYILPVAGVVYEWIIRKPEKELAAAKTETARLRRETELRFRAHFEGRTISEEEILRVLDALPTYEVKPVPEEIRVGERLLIVPSSWYTHTESYVPLICCKPTLEQYYRQAVEQAHPAVWDELNWGRMPASWDYDLPYVFDFIFRSGLSDYIHWCESLTAHAKEKIRKCASPLRFSSTEEEFAKLTELKQHYCQVRDEAESRLNKMKHSPAWALTACFSDGKIDTLAHSVLNDFLAQEKSRQESLRLLLNELRSESGSLYKPDRAVLDAFRQSSRPIPLFETTIAGAVFLKKLQVSSSWWSPGIMLRLEAEPGNPYDKSAVKILRQADNVLIGYLPRRANPSVFALLQSGKVVEAETLPLHAGAGVYPIRVVFRDI